MKFYKHTYDSESYITVIIFTIIASDGRMHPIGSVIISVPIDLLNHDTHTWVRK